MSTRKILEWFEVRDYVLRELNILPSFFFYKKSGPVIKTPRLLKYIFYDKNNVGNIGRNCHSKHLKPETVMI
jgi:hypothetical protein